MALFDFLNFNRKGPAKSPDELKAQFSVGGTGGNPVNQPLYVEKNSAKHIYNFGRLNDYPDKLIKLYDTSPTNQAIINRTALMIAGGNTEIEIVDEKDLLNLIHVVSLQRYPNQKQNLEQVIFSLSFDAKLHGRYAIECTWNDAHDRVVELKAISVEGVRVGLLEDGKVKSLKYSSDWADNKEPVITYEPFDRYGTKTRQLLHVQTMRSGHLIYGLPDYYASLTWITLEKEIGDHYLASALDGFSPKVSVVFPGKPESEEIEDEIINNLNAKYTGAKGKKIIGVFSPRPELMPKFEPINIENIDKQYNVIDEQTQNKILTGHGVVSPMLFGVKTPGQLGGTAELETAFNIYQKTVVAPYQNMIQRSLNEILDASGNKNRILLTPLDIIKEDVIEIEGETAQGNKVAEALNSMSPLVATKVLENLTINEIRALGGLDKVADGDTVKSQIQTAQNFRE